MTTPRDCKNCKHYVLTDTRTNWGNTEPTKIYSCEKWECKFEPTDAVTNAYNRGYADGMRAQAEHMRLCNEERGRR